MPIIIFLIEYVNTAFDLPTVMLLMKNIKPNKIPHIYLKCHNNFEVVYVYSCTIQCAIGMHHYSDYPLPNRQGIETKGSVKVISTKLNAVVVESLPVDRGEDLVQSDVDMVFIVRGSHLACARRHFHAFKHVGSGVDLYPCFFFFFFFFFGGG